MAMSLALCTVCLRAITNSPSSISFLQHPGGRTSQFPPSNTRILLDEVLPSQHTQSCHQPPKRLPIMSVEAVTAQMATTTVKDTAAVDGADKQAQNDAVIASAAEGRRLYIGNLAYATTEGELKDFFKDYLVETTSIPVNPRTTRPVGYAFVDVSTPSEAERAINELNGKTIMDRKVSVQLARKPEPAAAAVAAEATEGGEGTKRRNSTRGRGRSGRGRGGRAARGGRGKKDGETNGEAATEETNGAPAPAVAPAVEAATTEPAAGEGEKGARAPRKQRGPPEDGVPSKTKIMVANLPYDLGEEKLLEIFAEYSPVSAKIALRPIPKFMVRKLQARKEPRKGRGFGFVTLSSEELQQKACTEMNGKEIEGREIAVKVAIDSPGKEDEDPSAVAETEGEVKVTTEAAATETATSA
ncbi:RNA-binding domain-containing protein [Acrodontium crateriforme]|uniref:RNA-binding domain-containing protein n=1 Tax=Acrodontium crateriforme TaxID=150365 RepID=A0AAQ3M8B9_9PEZI|nr:RNA-binding domain-containing protein [Acrodontium crateriforme]